MRTPILSLALDAVIILVGLAVFFGIVIALVIMVVRWVQRLPL